MVPAVLMACNNSSGNPDVANSNVTGTAKPVIQYTIKRSLPHDTSSYTEGLLLYNGALFESTGSPDNLPNTKSVAGQVDITTGKINTKVELDRRQYFGEGIVILNDKLYQLTYQQKTGFVYDAKTFKKLDSFRLVVAEGWGLTTDGTHLIMSDGTCNISYVDPSNYKLIKVLRVTDNGSPVQKLNELEYVNGFLYANIYTTSDIVKIDAQSGEVVGRLDCSALERKARERYARSLEMNGIAWDSTAHTFYVTGKMWPNIYEISFPH
jgi:glutamine cyclotransferase